MKNYNNFYDKNRPGSYPTCQNSYPTNYQGQSTPCHPCTPITSEVQIGNQQSISPQCPCQYPILSELNNIECKLNYSYCELKEIQAEIESPSYGLQEIKTEVAHIENLLTDPSYGLFEIKTEVTHIENLLTDPSYGLFVIKTEVTHIENLLTDPSYGLFEIKTEVAHIENLLRDPSYGLFEIKTELCHI